MHNIEHYTYSEAVDKKRVQRELDEFVAHEDWQEGASGLPAPIRWVENPVYESYEAAYRAIEDADKGKWYNQMAVRFKDYPRVTKSKELAAISERIKKQDEAVKKIVADASVKNRTSEFIGCPKCGSSLKRELLSGEACPLCRADLRSKTNIERIAKAKAKSAELGALYRETETKLERKQKPTVKWLVKIEYHT